MKAQTNSLPANDLDNGATIANDATLFEEMFANTTPEHGAQADSTTAADHRTATHNALLKVVNLIKRISKAQFHPLRWLSQIIRAPFIALRRASKCSKTKTVMHRASKYSKIEKAILLIIAACILAVLLASCVKLWEENDIEIHPLPTTNLPTTQTPWEPQNPNNLP